MEKTDYSWCFNGNVECTVQYGRPSACLGFDVCGSDGCSSEICTFDCGRDCYADGCSSDCMLDN